MLNGIDKGRAASTRANRKEQVDALKKALCLNRKYNDEVAHNNSDFISSPDSGSPSSSNTQTKGLPEKYFYEGSSDKLMIEALTELNINDIQDFLMAGGPDKSEQFEKEKRAPPPQYHLESSRGDVKDLTSFEL